MAIDPGDGKILLVGTSNNNFALARYNGSDGTLDVTFDGDSGSGNGKITTNVSGGVSTDSAYAVALLEGGDFVVAGKTYSDMAVVRYHADGTLDTAFGGGDGIALTTTAAIGIFPVARGVAAQPDGKVVLGGYTVDNYGNYYAAAARFTADGSLDTTFSSDGMVMVSMTAPALPEEMAFDVALQADGRVLLAGVSSAELLLARLTAGGELDTTFGGGDGMVTTNVAGGACDAVGYALEVGPDGRVTVVGEANYSFGVARYLMPAGLETRLYVQQDANFNVTSVTDAFGEVRQPYGYEAYGKRTLLTAGFTVAAGGTVSLLANGFQGGRIDSFTGDVHFRHRDVDVELGRPKTADPTGYPDGMSRYEYVMSSPGRHVDPLGLDAYLTGEESAVGHQGFALDLWTCDPVTKEHRLAGVLEIDMHAPGYMETKNDHVPYRWWKAHTVTSLEIDVRFLPASNVLLGRQTGNQVTRPVITTHPGSVGQDLLMLDHLLTFLQGQPDGFHESLTDRLIRHGKTQTITLRRRDLTYSPFGYNCRSYARDFEQLYTEFFARQAGQFEARSVPPSTGPELLYDVSERGVGPHNTTTRPARPSWLRARGSTKRVP